MKEKLYYTIGEIAKELNIPTHNIRYWEREIPSIAPKNRVGGKRAYKKNDVEKIKELHDLLNNKKMTIEGAKKLIENKNELTLFTTSINSCSSVLNIRNELKEIVLLVQKL